MPGDHRRSRYQRIREQIAELIEATSSPIAHRATAAAILQAKIPKVSWTGFYMLREGALVVDVYQGPLACLVLEAGRGVCWASIEREETLVINDVQAFPGHIPCDAQARSELVVPIHDGAGRVIGVLDVDSHELDHFDEVDREGYESIIELLELVQK
jgi:L-methionine (R)-S-oxide reductase